jgi:hypothetical protein
MAIKRQLRHQPLQLLNFPRNWRGSRSSLSPVRDTSFATDKRCGAQSEPAARLRDLPAGFQFTFVSASIYTIRQDCSVECARRGRAKAMGTKARRPGVSSQGWQAASGVFAGPTTEARSRTAEASGGFCAPFASPHIWYTAGRSGRGRLHNHAPDGALNCESFTVICSSVTRGCRIGVWAIHGTESAKGTHEYWHAQTDFNNGISVKSFVSKCPGGETGRRNGLKIKPNHLRWVAHG